MSPRKQGPTAPNPASDADGTREGGLGAPPSPSSIPGLHTYLAERREASDKELAKLRRRQESEARLAKGREKRRASSSTKKNTPQLASAAQELRDRTMLQQHMAGKTIAVIADEYGLHPGTVSRVLNTTARQLLATTAKDYVGQRLLPKALKVLETALDAGNIDVAKDIVHGLAIIGAKATPYGVEVAASGDTVVETFEALRLKLVRARGVGGESGDAPADSRSDEKVIDAIAVVSASESA